MFFGATSFYRERSRKISIYQIVETLCHENYNVGKKGGKKNRVYIPFENLITARNLPAIILVIYL